MTRIREEECSLCRRAVFITFVYSIEMSKHILKLLTPSGRHTILVFHTKPCGNITIPPPQWGRRMQVG